MALYSNSSRKQFHYMGWGVAIFYKTLPCLNYCYSLAFIAVENRPAFNICNILALDSAIFYHL